MLFHVMLFHVMLCYKADIYVKHRNTLFTGEGLII